MKDAISLGVGEPDFDTPWHIRDEGIYSLEKGRTFYTSNAGLMELRKEICNYLERRFDCKYDPKTETLITVGGSEAIDMALRAMVNPGDEVIIPQPSYVSSVAIMFLMNIELNIVTLAALIVVLGMVVDNAIVVIDGYLEYLGKGYDPKKAAIDSAKQYFIPMMLATLCICVIFFPLLYTMKGAFHDALEDFPMTITINLMVSLFLAVTVIPFLEVLLIKPSSSSQPSQSSQTGSTSDNAITRWVQNTYDKVLDFTFRHPWLTIVGGIGIILLSCVILPALKIRVFPYADRDQFAVEIFLPEGKSS